MRFQDFVFTTCQRISKADSARVTANRIISQCGTVITADFRRKNPGIEMKSQTTVLFLDEFICVARVTLLIGTTPLATYHFAADLNTGNITSIT